MFKYGLYLTYLGSMNPFGDTKEVEGYLILPGTIPVAIWGTINYKGNELREVIPIRETQSVEELDKQLKTLIKRLKDRIEMIKSLEEEDGKIQTKETKN